MIACDEMVQKIKAAVDARKDQDLQIVARTDARAIEGIDAAIARAQAYVEAGADVTFVEAPLDLAELRRIASDVRVPQIANMLEGRFISEHDYLIAGKIADILCGGDLEAGSLVDEQWLLDLERRHFMELLATEKTQARIEQMLKTGKPLRN